MIDALQWFFTAWRAGLAPASWLVIAVLVGAMSHHLFSVFLLMWSTRRRDADDTAYDMERRTRNADDDWMPGRVAIRPDAANFDTMAAVRDARLADRKRRKRLADRKRRQAAAQ